MLSRACSLHMRFDRISSLMLRLSRSAENAEWALSCPSVEGSCSPRKREAGWGAGIDDLSLPRTLRAAAVLYKRSKKEHGRRLKGEAASPPLLVSMLLCGANAKPRRASSLYRANPVAALDSKAGMLTMNSRQHPHAPRMHLRRS